MYWKDNHHDIDNNGNTDSNKKQNDIIDQRNEAILMSKRYRKTPFTKKDYLYGR